MLDLHVWGSAFGLASIDPECLAAITYLHNSLPALSWCLIPSNDPSLTPSNALPALFHDGAWTSGYGSIVEYLKSKSLGTDLDASLTPIDEADRVAYSAFLAAHAAPLLDLSLYVSAANWSATTRPAYSKLLPFPLTWTEPPLIRAAAAKRVENLGFADLDSDLDPNGSLHLSTGRDSLPETLRRHLPARNKKTVREEMTPEMLAAIRLSGLTEDCLGVMEKLLKGGDEKPFGFFEGANPSSLDCLAFGYFALMWEAPVPRSFVKDWIRDHAPRAAKFVNDMKSRCIEQPGSLPWTESGHATALRVSARTVDSVIRNAPSIGEEYSNEMRRRAEQGVTGLDTKAVLLTMGAMLTGGALWYGYNTYKALQPFGARTQAWKAHRTRLSEFGELGAMLGGAFGGFQTPLDAPGPTNMSSEARLVETDTDVD